MSGVRPVAALAVGAVAVVAFLPTVGAGFVNWDDEASFLNNPHYRGLGPRQLAWMLTTRYMGHWSPLPWMTWGLNYVLGGLDPWGYHLANVFIHGANVALLCAIAARLIASGLGRSADDWPVVAGAAFAACVFGLHPLRAESVAWISERRDLLCGLFYLAAVLAYLRGVDGGGRIRARWWGLSVAAFAAALASKAIAMTLPATLLLLDVYPLRRRGLGWRTLAPEKLPYVALAATAAVVAVIARQEGGNLTAYDQYGPGARVALTGYALWFYPWKLVWPAGLSPAYELPARIELTDPRFLGPTIAVLAVTTLLCAVARRWPAGLAAWVASAIVLAPISGAVHPGNQLASDRYSYLSGLGFAVLAGAALTWLLVRGEASAQWRWTRPLAGAAALVAALALGAGARSQAAVWHDSESLWRHATAVDPNCAMCESNLGRAIAVPGRYAEAERHLRRAIELRPDRPGAHETLGAIMLAQGRHAEAERHFRESAALLPTHGPYRNNLGVALANQGRYAEAEAEFREAGRLSPRLVDSPANLGLLLVRQGRYEDAIDPLRRALALDPGNERTRALLARSLRHRAVELARAGRRDLAEPVWNEAAALAPEDPDLLRAFSQAVVEQGQGRAAGPVAEAERSRSPLEAAVPSTPAGSVR